MIMMLIITKIYNRNNEYDDDEADGDYIVLEDNVAAAATAADCEEKGFKDD